MFQHTAARRRLGKPEQSVFWRDDVSTHSRSKAAGKSSNQSTTAHYGFNTQPLEGGWMSDVARFRGKVQFQHTAARRRLGIEWFKKG